MPLLANAVSKIDGRVGLLIVDQLCRVAGDSHKNAEVRRGLQPVVDFAHQYACAVIGITDFTKGTQGRDTVERITGSLAFGALPRVVFAVAHVRTPEDEQAQKDGPPITDRMFIRAATNIGSDGGGFYYRLERVPVPGKKDLQAQAVKWHGLIDGKANDLLATAVDKTMRPSEFLIGLLANGQMQAKAVFKAAQAQGFTEKQMQNAASHLRQDGKINRTKVGMQDGWSWQLVYPERLNSTEQTVSNSSND